MLDTADNSVTISRRLFQHIKEEADEGADASVFVYHIPEFGTYAFSLAPTLEKPTQLAQIQYNEKYKCVGFETLCPSVGTILYKYGLPANHAVKLSVDINRKLPGGQTIYQFLPPHEQHIRKHAKA